MKLTVVERIILANQYRILEFLDPEHRDDHKFAQLMIERGFESDINDLAVGFWDWFDAAECEFVTDVFLMYRALQEGYSALTDKHGIKPSLLDMPGFDGSRESQYHAYAQFSAKDYTNVRLAEIATKDLNSHMPTVERYRGMLARWKALPDRYVMDRASIMKVLDCASTGDDDTDSGTHLN